MIEPGEVANTITKATAGVTDLSQDLNTIKNVFRLIDLTSLNNTDNQTSISKLCQSALRVMDKNPDFRVAAVCVYPNLVNCAIKNLEDSGISVAAVAGGFPSAMIHLEQKTAEISRAVGEGAKEIDIVLPLGAFHARDFDLVEHEINEMKKACGKAHLKVILENCDLSTRKTPVEQIQAVYKASLLALRAGADFIKTSTGKSSGGATPEDVTVMLHAILEYRLTASEHRGIKAAGGIKTMAGAMLYYALYEALIPEPPSPGICRLGASSLAYELVTHYDSICQKSGKKSELAKAFKGS